MYRPHIDNIVSSFNYIQVVFNYHYRISTFRQTMNNINGGSGNNLEKSIRL